MIAALLAVGTLFTLLLVGYVLYWKQQARVAVIETTQLPSSVAAYIPIGSALLRVGGMLAGLLLGFILMLPALVEALRGTLGSVTADPVLYCFGGVGALLSLLAGIGVVQAIANLFLNTPLNRNASPVLVMNRDEIKFRGSRMPWTAAREFRTYVAPSARLPDSYTYAVLTLITNCQPKALNLTDTVAAWFYRGHRYYIQRQLKLAPGSFTLIPLFGFSRSQFDLAILAHRYWCQATGHEYKPESIEALFPQKTLTDYAKN